MQIEPGKFYKKEEYSGTFYFAPKVFKTNGTLGDYYRGEFLTLLSANHEDFPEGTFGKNGLVWATTIDKYSEITLEEFNAARELARSMI
jgi:hypothetical protein